MVVWFSGGLVAKSCLTLATLWTVARQAPLSMGFSWQEHRSSFVQTLRSCSTTHFIKVNLKMNWGPW